jgi:hypothetical protein
MTCSYPSRLAQVLLVVLASGCVVTEPIDDGAATEATTTADTVADSTGGASSTSRTTGDATADAGDATDTSADTVVDTTGTTGTGPTTDDGSSSDTGSEGTCSGVPEFQCSEPIDCSMLPCGDVLFPFDAEGCMRPPCSGSDQCDDDQFCFLPYEAYEVCTSSGMACSDGPDGACECVSTPDCSGGYCMTDCHDLSDDPDTCGAAGCSATTVVAISDTCECTEGVPVCFDGPAGIGIDTGYLWHEETLEVAYFGARLFAVPLRWRLCTDPEAPPACGCFDPTLPPECP